MTKPGFLNSRQIFVSVGKKPGFCVWIHKALLTERSEYFAEQLVNDTEATPKSLVLSSWNTKWVQRYLETVITNEIAEFEGDLGQQLGCITTIYAMAVVFKDSKTRDICVSEMFDRLEATYKNLQGKLRPNEVEPLAEIVTRLFSDHQDYRGLAEEMVLNICVAFLGHDGIVFIQHTLPRRFLLQFSLRLLQRQGQSDFVWDKDRYLECRQPPLLNNSGTTVPNTPSHKDSLSTGNLTPGQNESFQVPNSEVRIPNTQAQEGVAGTPFTRPVPKPDARTNFATRPAGIPRRIAASSPPQRASTAPQKKSTEAPRQPGNSEHRTTSSNTPTEAGPS
ncbi:hypothetical protein BU24DRAFT_491280 [Aaosphaeria arxii CBS 175.79]|uniref:BTB domain-containing protein n=1 Tax=Aaosphaeria arxii CBS 175.79 TaxID=1450172 RepID=A0A6A5XZ70_9PLEO|nr:uncharacterized protein BU24DRAFT_491280 [Aaosphaeria arxii CBS 175.79]KAF2018296.1 hypothetical protein BU24DRAFT_491280 [Aaosphaeria arxii CBS 175.79]